MFIRKFAYIGSGPSVIVFTNEEFAYMQSNIDEINDEILNHQWFARLYFGGLRYNKEREILSTRYEKRAISLFSQLDCVQKIFYGTGSNAYYYYAPTRFQDFLFEKLKPFNLKIILDEGLDIKNNVPSRKKLKI